MVKATGLRLEPVRTAGEKAAFVEKCPKFSCLHGKKKQACTRAHTPTHVHTHPHTHRFFPSLHPLTAYPILLKLDMCCQMGVLPKGAQCSRVLAVRAAEWAELVLTLAF